MKRIRIQRQRLASEANLKPELLVSGKQRVAFTPRGSQVQSLSHPPFPLQRLMLVGMRDAVRVCVAS